MATACFPRLGLGLTGTSTPCMCISTSSCSDCSREAVALMLPRATDIRSPDSLVLYMLRRDAIRLLLPAATAAVSGHFIPLIFPQDP